MITPDYVQIMARYNAEMNRRVYHAAGELNAAERRESKGAYWGSIQGTLNHLLWADHMWMSRFDGWPKPTVGIKESAAIIADFAALHSARVEADAMIARWASHVSQTWLDQDLVWFSGAAGRELCKPRQLLVAHFFNHQTHHRGQVHALLSAAGRDTGDTDLFLVV